MLCIISYLYLISGKSEIILSHRELFVYIIIYIINEQIHYKTLIVNINCIINTIYIYIIRTLIGIKIFILNFKLSNFLELKIFPSTKKLNFFVTNN